MLTFFLKFTICKEIGFFINWDHKKGKTVQLLAHWASRESSTNCNWRKHYATAEVFLRLKLWHRPQLQIDHISSSNHFKGHFEFAGDDSLNIYIFAHCPFTTKASQRIKKNRRFPYQPSLIPSSSHGEAQSAARCGGFNTSVLEVQVSWAGNFVLVGHVAMGTWKMFAKLSKN